MLTEFKLVSAKEDKEIIQFDRVDPEHVEEWAQAALPRSKQHDARQSLRRTCLRTVQQYWESTDQRVETGYVSMAREVTSVKTRHTRTDSSESHQARAVQSATVARLSQAEADHEVQGEKVPRQRSRRTPY